MRRIASKTRLGLARPVPPHDIFLPSLRKKNIYLIYKIYVLLSKGRKKNVVTWTPPAESKHVLLAILRSCVYPFSFFENG